MIEEEFWNSLKMFTNARIGLQSSGTSISTSERLKLQLAYANARDAVHMELNEDILKHQFKDSDLVVHFLQSRVGNKEEYLHRPDLGRKLNDGSSQYLKELNSSSADLAFIICDGLSATAVHEHAFGFLNEFYSMNKDYSYASVSLIRYGRVAIGDEVGALLNAKMSLLLIGERPGLSAADSLGIYTTYNPRPGLTDESRNCISNIHVKGLTYKQAADKLSYLVRESLRRKLSGVQLKDDSDLRLSDSSSLYLDA